MNKLFVLFPSLLMAACVTYGTMEKPDAFVNAAVSWEGGHIREMISVWGLPNDGFIEPSRYMNGTAKWKLDEADTANPYADEKPQTSCSGSVTDKWGNVEADCRTYDANRARRQGYEFGQQAGAAFSRRCFVTAEFTEAGIILKVVAASQNCSSGDVQRLSRVVRWTDIN